MAVIDTRGSTDELFRNLGTLVGKLTENEDEKMREYLFQNPERATAIADETHRFILQTPGATDVQSAVAIRQKSKETGDARDRVEFNLDAAPGQGELSLEVLQELVDTTPESRQSRLNRIVDDTIPVESEAEALRLRMERQKAEDSLVVRQAQDELQVITTMAELGVDPERQAEFRVANLLLEENNVQLTRDGQRYLQRMIEDPNLSEHDRRVLMTGLTPQGNTLFQDLQMHERMNFEDVMARYRAGMANAGSELEMEIQLFKAKQLVRDSNYQITERLRAAVEEGNKDEIQGLVEEFRDNASTMLRLDPSVVVTTANEIRGLLRGVKDVEFSVLDITNFNEGLAASLDAAAKQFVKDGMSDVALQNLRAAYLDSGTGRVNERFVTAVQMRAMELSQDASGDAEAANMVTAAMEAQRQVRDQGMNRQAADALLEELYGELNELLVGSGGLGNARILALMSEIKRAELMKLFATNPFQGEG